MNDHRKPVVATVLVALALTLAFAAPLPAAGKTSPPKAPTESDIDDALAELAKADQTDWIIQYRAISRLGRWKVKRAEATLRKILTGTSHPWTRGRALVALAEIFADKVLPDAIRYAKDPKPPMRAAAVEAIGMIGSAKGDSVVIAALNDKAPTVRHQAVLALARLRKAKAWPLIKPLLKDRDVKMIRHVAQALVNIPTVESRKTLIALLTHPDADVRLQAARAMRVLHDPAAITPLLGLMASDRARSVQIEAERSLASYQRPVLSKHMLASLRSETSTETYRGALKLLAAGPDRESCDAAAALVAEKPGRYEKVLKEILAFLVSVEPDRYGPTFIKYLDHKDYNVRAQAVIGLGKCKKVDHFTVLKDRLSDKQGIVRTRAFAALTAATKGAPTGGILAYLDAPLRARDSRTFMLAMDLVSERITQKEMSKGLGAVEPVLAGSDRYRRQLAVRSLTKKADDKARTIVARAQGYISEWNLLGPFPNDENNRGFDAVYPPEIEVDFKKEYAAHVFGSGAELQISKDQEGRPVSITITPPSIDVTGKTIVSWYLDLPASKNLELNVSAALVRKKSETNGVKLSVVVDDKPLATRDIRKGEAAEKFKISLAAYAGKKVQLRLIIDALGDADNDQTTISSAAIFSGRNKLIDLIELAPSAAARMEIDGQPQEKMRWYPYKVPDAGGSATFHALFKPPTHYKVAYAVCDLESPKEQAVFLDLQADDGAAVTLNGKQVFRQSLTGMKGGPRNISAKIKVTLQKGTNRLFVKIPNLKDWWYLRIRIVDAKGNRAL